MNRTEREAAARRIMEQTPSPVPPDLYGEVLRRGGRMLRRRRAARRMLWLLLCTAAVAFTVWAVLVRPWAQPPSTTTPPVVGW